MNSFLIIEKNISLEKIEAYYKKLNKFTSLVLPSKLKYSLLGNKVALAQLIFSWERKSVHGKLYLYDSNNFGEDEIKEIISDSYHLMIAIMIASNKGIYGYNTGKNISEIVLDCCENEIKRTNSSLRLDEKKGSEFYQIHIDHLGEDLWFSDDFYLYNPHIDKYTSIPKHIYEIIIRKIIEKSTPKGIISLDAIVKKLTPLIYELFDNTINWASTINDKGNTQSNCRSIYLRFVNHEYKLFKKSVSGIKPLENYFSNNPKILHKANNTDYAYFLELSIIDSGVGLASKYSGINFKSENNILVEYEKVCTCFQKHKSTVSGYSAQTRGMGLFNVLLTLYNIAFLKLRTGHLSLYRDFTLTPFNNLDSSTVLFDTSDVICNDVSANEQVHKYDWAEGTSITILLPLNLI